MYLAICGVLNTYSYVVKIINKSIIKKLMLKNIDNWRRYELDNR